MKDRLITEMGLSLTRMNDLEDLSKLKKIIDQRIAFLRTNQSRKPTISDIVEFKMGQRFIRGQIKRIAGKDAVIQEEVTGRPFPRVPLDSLRVMTPTEAIV